MTKTKKTKRLEDDPFRQTYTSLRARRSELLTELERLDGVLAAYSVAFDVAEHGFRESDTTQSVRGQIEEALVQIARKNGGIFDTYTNKEELLRRGIIDRDAKSLSQRIYNALDSSAYFKKAGKKGRWELRESRYIEDHGLLPDATERKGD